VEAVVPLTEQAAEVAVRLHRPPGILSLRKHIQSSLVLEEITTVRATVAPERMVQMVAQARLMESVLQAVVEGREEQALLVIMPVLVAEVP
jgi:hypothetical protein